MKKFHFILIMSLASLFLIMGCQTAPVSEDSSAKNAPQSLPYSNGPTSPPAVKGPTIPLPGQNPDTVRTEADGTGKLPQAVTETETVRYTLPESKNPDFKQ